MNTSLPYTLQNCFAAARDEAEVSSLLNNDIYKFLMLDFILAHPEYRDMRVRWAMTVRDPNVHLAEVIPEHALRSQLDMTQSIEWVTEADLSYLRGMTTSTGRRLFREETLQFLREFRLPEYQLENDGNGGYDLSFEGSWATSMMWEIPALKIVNSLYLYHYAKKAQVTPSEWNGVMTKTFARLYSDIDTMREDSRITFSEFGTRRAASTDIHRRVLEILQSELPGQCLGSSNVMLSREIGSSNPRGTNAHELRMIPTAFEDESENIIDKMYEVDRQWMAHFPELAILLPDTFGSTFYFKNAPRDIIEGHTWVRFDSKDPMVAIPEYVNWLLEYDQDPARKVWIPSDGLTAESMVEIVRNNVDMIGNLTHGFGTGLTNNTKGTFPKIKEKFGPFGSFSVVVKPEAVWREDKWEWVSTVKLSDNPNKAKGSVERVELFRKTFGVEGMEKQTVVV
jgi:nicotinate phosphoribosyltransferase